MISISSCCKVRRIFTMRTSLAEKNLQNFNYIDDKIEKIEKIEQNEYSDDLPKHLILPVFLHYENINVNYDHTRYYLEEKKAIKENSRILEERSVIKNRSKSPKQGRGRKFNNKNKGGYSDMYSTPEKELYSKQIFLHNGSSSPDDNNYNQYNQYGSHNSSSMPKNNMNLAINAKSSNTSNGENVGNVGNVGSVGNVGNSGNSGNTFVTSNPNNANVNNHIGGAKYNNINIIKNSSSKKDNISNANQQSFAKKKTNNSNSSSQKHQRKNEDITEALSNKNLNQWEGNEDNENLESEIEQVCKTEKDEADRNKEEFVGQSRNKIK